MEIMARKVNGTRDGLILEYVHPDGIHLMNLWMSSNQFADERVYVDYYHGEIYLWFPPEVLLVG